MWRIFTFHCSNEHFATMPSQRYLSRTASTRQPSHLELFKLDSPVNVAHSGRENSVPHHILGETYFAGGLPDYVSRYHRCGQYKALCVGGDTAGRRGHRRFDEIGVNVVPLSVVNKGISTRD